MLEIARCAFPVFVTTMGWEELDAVINSFANVSLMGARPAPGVVVTPVPLRLITCGESNALSAKRIVAVLVPRAEGVNAIVMVQ